MNRRKAIGGIFAITGISLTSFSGYHLFYANGKVIRGQLQRYNHLIAELVNVIIPPTDTPGAKEAKVQDYVIGFMESCASNKEYNNFMNGLTDLEEACLNDYDANFESCTAEQKIAVLQDLDSDTDQNSLIAKINKKLRGLPFFSILKSLTVEGYCTSKLGATGLLAYQPIPARYKPITTLQPNQKAWATS